MSEDGKRFGGAGAMVVRAPADDRKPSSASSASLASAKKVIIKSADMKEDLQREAVDIAIAAFEKHNVEKDVAEAIKKEFDRKHGPTWHCIVGKNFGRQKPPKTPPLPSRPPRPHGRPPYTAKPPWAPNQTPMAIGVAEGHFQAPRRPPFRTLFGWLMTHSHRVWVVSRSRVQVVLTMPSRTWSSCEARLWSLALGGAVVAMALWSLLGPTVGLESLWSHPGEGCYTQLPPPPTFYLAKKRKNLDTTVFKAIQCI